MRSAEELRMVVATSYGDCPDQGVNLGLLVSRLCPALCEVGRALDMPYVGVSFVCPYYMRNCAFEENIINETLEILNP